MLFTKPKKAKRDTESRAATLTLQSLLNDDAFEFAENDSSNDVVPAVVEEKDFFGGAPAPEDLYPDIGLFADVFLGIYSIDDNDTVEPLKKKEPKRRLKNPAKNCLSARVKKKERPPKTILYEQTLRSMIKDAATTSRESPSARAKKRGRPKKIAGNEENPRSMIKDAAATSSESPSARAKKRGRPKKISGNEENPRSMIKDAAATSSESPSARAKKRGRPKKIAKNEQTTRSMIKGAAATSCESPSARAKKRGRPKKI
uniref:Uncharacterized protein n=1 Tax=Panagrolaimus sp. PS1159 TaxID=55785 RepID=A0AC35GAM0_9BILA